MKRPYAQLLLLIMLIALDQWSKWWIEGQPPFFHLTVIENWFNLVKAHNFGVAFSMFADWDHAWRTRLLLGVTMGIAFMVALWWWKERNKSGPDTWLLIMILAGAVGNIWDRVQLGYVVDFIQWYIVIDGHAYYWPSFNLADAYISVSVVMLLVTGLKKTRHD